MNKLKLITLGIIASSVFTSSLSPKPTETLIPIVKNKTEIIKNNPIQDLYDSLNLKEIIKWEAFEEAMQGYNQLAPKNKNIITIIDFTLPSTDKRMYVLDLKAKKLLYHTIVSHGRNSGEKYATSFSNRHGSFQSSLGFYVTEGTYMGGNGYSLRLDGLEKGINDQAKPRAIVIHGADYCSQDVIRNTGRLGRSYGCPALPRELNKPIINTIKDGSLVYIYANNKQYLAATKMVKKPAIDSNHMLIAKQPIAVEDDSKTILN
ncbi:murein L,D-transpeptidase catalytic domain family protein [Sphingobacterium sp. HJSM2_6]|uniref:murein L,D-transpeptidase catalytic domain family protein n=1 Tax=Sphingobacterium sp. HJSM2_6 TaxID=3366264 RepID=UPI003BEE4043